MERIAGIAVEQLGTGQPLLLIHGTGGTHHHWRPLVDHLRGERTLFLVDLPGHGKSPSPLPGLPHNPIGYARALATMLDELDLERVHCAGNSVGGWTALELAKLGRANSVVAIAPAGLWPKRDPWRCTLQLWAQYELGRVFAPLTRSAMRNEAGRSILLRGTVAKPRQMPADAAVEMAAEFARTPDFRAHLASTRRARFAGGRDLNLPITIAWGEKERLIPRKARRMDELPDQTRVVILPGCGHSPMWDDPELVSATVLSGEVGKEGRRR